MTLNFRIYYLMVTIIDDERMANFRFSPTVELPFAVRSTAPTRASVQEKTQLIDSPPREKNGACERVAFVCVLAAVVFGIFTLIGTTYLIEEKQEALVTDLRHKVLDSASVSASEAEDVISKLFDVQDDADAASIADVQNATFHLAAAVETLRKHHCSK